MTKRERCEWSRMMKKELARMNGLVYLQGECKEENCPGTCQTCAAEDAYLNDQLARKALAGEALHVAEIFQTFYSGDNPKSPFLDLFHCLKETSIDSLDEIARATSEELESIREFSKKSLDDILNLAKELEESMKAKKDTDIE